MDLGKFWLSDGGNRIFIPGFEILLFAHYPHHLRKGPIFCLVQSYNLLLVSVKWL
jgi:hypothetical protein